MNEDIPELLTVPQVAIYLQKTPAAVRQMIARGQLPGVVRMGRCVRVARDRLRAAVGAADKDANG